MALPLGQSHDTKILDFALAGLTNPAKICQNGLDLAIPTLLVGTGTCTACGASVRPSCGWDTLPVGTGTCTACGASVQAEQRGAFSMLSLEGISWARHCSLVTETLIEKMMALHGTF
jgi:hypothetical protein